MSAEFRSIVQWLVGSTTALMVALAMLPTSLVDGQYLPLGHDSFYHARRILDTAARPDLFYEFDPRMHFPEGDWITWPWGYDYLMAQAVRGLMALTDWHNPMKVLVHLPPMFVVVAVALVLAIASRLKLSEPLRWLVVFCVALSPHTQVLFGLGSIDHHWAEHLFALGTVLFGILWLERPESGIRAAVLGVTVGTAVAFHAGLFVLQLPVLTGLAVLWFRGATPPTRSALVFAATLVATTLLVSLPSAPFRMGWFQLYYLSWFQAYIALCTGLISVALCRWSYRPRVLAALLVLGLLLLLPVLAQLRFSGAFLSGDLSAVQRIDEIRSPLAVALSGRDGTWRVVLVYTMLVFAAPLTLLGCLISLAKETQRELVFFWVFSVFGLIFVLLQQRLHGFGSFALYLPWLLWAQRLGQRYPGGGRAATVAIGVLLLIAYAPSVSRQLFARHLPAMDGYYAGARNLFPILAEACRKRPGLVVADPNDGHLIRYFTECSVIGNNFRLTPHDVGKYEESRRLLSMPLDQVLAERPEAMYVLARLAVPVLRPDDRSVDSEAGMSMESLRRLNRGVFGQLLIGGRPLPPGVAVVAEVKLRNTAGELIPIQGIYSVTPRSTAEPKHP